MSTAKPILACFGMGYTSHRLASIWQQRHFLVRGTCRSEAKKRHLVQEGISAYRFDPSEQIDEAAEMLPDTTHLLLSIPPNAEGDPVWNRYYDIIGSMKSLQWIGYLSTTGVYGDHGGSWIDENTLPAAPEERHRLRVQAEQQWLSLQKKRKAVHVFRLAGIYGPERSAIDQLKEGDARRIYKEGHYFSRIHVDDIVQVLLASMDQPNTGRIYNVCDDEPAPSHEVVEYASGLLGIEPPPIIPYEEAELSEMARSFYRSNRRVRNDRIKDELKVILHYPTYREGLQAIVKLYEG